MGELLRGCRGLCPEAGNRPCPRNLGPQGLETGLVREIAEGRKPAMSAKSWPETGIANEILTLETGIAREIFGLDAWKSALPAKSWPWTSGKRHCPRNLCPEARNRHCRTGGSRQCPRNLGSERLENGIVREILALNACKQRHCPRNLCPGSWKPALPAKSWAWTPGKQH